MIIGRIPYLNSEAFFRGLTGHKSVPVMPRDTGALVSAGLVHATIMPTALYFNMEGQVFPLGELCIATTGPAKSVLLFSKREIHDLGGAEISITKQTASSSALLDILLRKAFGVQNFSYTEGDLYDRPVAYLSIGDEALYLKKRARSFPDYRIYDLGQLWHDWTGLPFVFAIWVIRGDIDENEAINLLSQLRRNLSLNLADIDALTEERRRKLGLSAAEARSYIKNFTYVMGSSERAGMARFRELLEL